MKQLFSRILITSTITITLAIASPSFAQTYLGSSFNEVWSVISNSNPIGKTATEKTEIDVYKDGKLPQYPVNAVSIFSKDKTALERDAIRTINERFDFYDRITKRVHPNGVCVAGEWIVTTTTPYSGGLATGFKGLFIGRLSVAMEKTVVGNDRGFGFAGKIFPTTNPSAKVKTGNFFTVDVLLGTKLVHILDAKTTNKPETGFNLSLIGLGLRIASALSKGDKDPSFRPLTQVADLGTTDLTEIKQPKFIRLSAVSSVLRNEEVDFRNEVLRSLKENGSVTYNVDVSNVTSNRKDSEGWTPLGVIKLYTAVTSYGCDRQLHFAHPHLK